MAVTRAFLLALLALATGLAGCLSRPPLLHVPDPHPVPLLAEAGDAQVTVGGLLVPNSDDNGTVLEGHLQAAASPIRHLGVFGLVSYVSEPEHTHRYLEAGAVLYGNLSETMRVDLLVGRGRGDVEGEGTYSTISTSVAPYTATAELERLFVQGTVWRQERYAQSGFSLRASQVRFFETEGLRGAGRELGSFRATYLEPGVFVRIPLRSGHSPLSVGLHGSLSFALAEPRGEVYRRRPFSLGAEVTLDVGRLLAAD